MKNIFLCIIVMLAFSGCIHSHSRPLVMTATEIKNTVTVGETTMDEVRERLGAPGSLTVFDKRVIWYYVYAKTAKRNSLPFTLSVADNDMRGHMGLEFDTENVLIHLYYYGNRWKPQAE